MNCIYSACSYFPVRLKLLYVALLLLLCTQTWSCLIDYQQIPSRSSSFLSLFPIVQSSRSNFPFCIWNECMHCKKRTGTLLEKLSLREDADTKHIIKWFKIGHEFLLNNECKYEHTMQMKCVFLLCAPNTTAPYFFAHCTSKFFFKNV